MKKTVIYFVCIFLVIAVCLSTVLGIGSKNNDSQIADLKAQVTELTAQLEESQSLNDYLTKTLKVAEELNESLRSELSAKNKRLSELQLETASLKTDVSQKETQVSELTQTKTQHEETIVILNNSIATLNNQIADLETNASANEEEIAALQSQVSDKQKEVEKKEGEISVLIDQIATYEQDIKGLNATIKSNEDQISSLTSEIRSKRETIISLEVQIEDLKIQIRDLEAGGSSDDPIAQSKYLYDFLNYGLDTLILMPGSGVVTIDEMLVEHFSALKHLFSINSLVKIGEYQFSSSSLEEVALKGVSTIGENGLSISGNAIVYIGEGIKKISDSAINLTNLTDDLPIFILDSVTVPEMSALMVKEAKYNSWIDIDLYVPDEAVEAYNSNSKLIGYSIHGISELESSNPELYESILAIRAM